MLNRKEFIEEIQKYIINERITQKELANRMRYSPSTICEWLSGKTLPGYEAIETFEGLLKKDSVKKL